MTEREYWEDFPTSCIQDKTITPVIHTLRGWETCSRYNNLIHIFSCEEAALEVLMSVCLWSGWNSSLYEGSRRFENVQGRWRFKETSEQLTRTLLVLHILFVYRVAAMRKMLESEIFVCGCLCLSSLVPLIIMMLILLLSETGIIPGESWTHIYMIWETSIKAEDTLCLSNGFQFLFCFGAASDLCVCNK